MAMTKLSLIINSHIGKFSKSLNLIMKSCFNLLRIQFLLYALKKKIMHIVHLIVMVNKKVNRFKDVQCMSSRHLVTKNRTYRIHCTLYVTKRLISSKSVCSDRRWTPIFSYRTYLALEKRLYFSHRRLSSATERNFLS